MIMPYLIDGNNVMAVLHRDRLIARRRLLRALAKFIAVQKVKVKVVFDGAPDDEFPDGIKVKSVQILYARPGSDADSRIKDLVRKASYKRDIIMVSSDKSLGGTVRHMGARVISSMKFRDMLQEAETAFAAKDFTMGAEVDIQEWLDYFNAPA